MTPTLTFDIDGVIADGSYIPEWDRQPEVYMGLGLVDPKIPNILHSLCCKANVYLVSSRRFPNATDTTRLWLQKVGIYIPMLAGVICNIPNPTKPDFLRMLGALRHVDDNPAVANALGKRGIWLNLPDNGWPQEATCPTSVGDWHTLHSVLSSVLEEANSVSAQIWAELGIGS